MGAGRMGARPVGCNGMPAPMIALVALAGAVLLVGAGRLCRARALPRLPLLLPLLALIGWVLTELLPLAWLPGRYRIGLGIAEDLLLAYAAVRLLLWLLLELPGGLRWWRRPPDLLVQLLTISSWSLISVLVVRETTQFDLVNLVATSAVLTAVIGLAVAAYMYLLKEGLGAKLAAARGPLYLFFYNKWFFDELYQATFVAGTKFLGDLFWKGGDQQIIDGLGPDGISAATYAMGRQTGKVQTGYVYHYAFVMLLGVAGLLSFALYAWAK